MVASETGQLRLRFPCENDRDTFEICRKEFASTSIPFAFGYEETTDFNDYLMILRNYRHGKNLPLGHVQALFLVAEVSGIVVGRITLRTKLSADLSIYGGHISYVVRPKFRGRGYAKEMLLESQRIAKQLGIKKLLLCTSPDNEASRRVILACGGVFESEVHYDDGLVRHRYWIKLGRPQSQNHGEGNAKSEILAMCGTHSNV